MKKVYSSKLTRVPYTADFKERAKVLFPEEKALHKYLKEGSWRARMYLDDSMAFGFSPQEILAMTEKQQIDDNQAKKILTQVIEAAKNLLYKEALCDEFTQDYGKICERLANAEITRTKSDSDNYGINIIR